MSVWVQIRGDVKLQPLQGSSAFARVRVCVSFHIKAQHPEQWSDEGGSGNKQINDQQQRR